jgi:hypothetical protein
MTIEKIAQDYCFRLSRAVDEINQYTNNEDFWDSIIFDLTQRCAVVYSDLEKLVATDINYPAFTAAIEGGEDFTQNIWGWGRMFNGKNEKVVFSVTVFSGGEFSAKQLMGPVKSRLIFSGRVEHSEEFRETIGFLVQGMS